MICSNCHNTTEGNYAAEFKGDYYHICDNCAATIPSEPTTIGVQLFQIINNKAVPYKLLTIHNVIKYWEGFADIVLQLPGITEAEMENTLQEVTLDELQTIGQQLQELALQHYPQEEQWKEHIAKGFAKPYALQGKIFTIYLSHDTNGWRFSVSSPYLHPLPDEFCQQIADCILPQEDVTYYMGKVSPNSPTTQFWNKKEP